MPFPIAITGPQQITLETSGWWNRPLVALCPTEIVFRARAAESLITNPFIEFLYDSVDIGSFGDCFPGMVAYISATDNIRDAKYRGRVRVDPTSTIFAIDQNATILNVGDRIIVVRDVDLFARIRNDTLVDSSITYRPLPPMTNGLPSCIVLYDSDNDGQVSYTSVQTGIVVDAAASSMASWAWDVSGSGSSSFNSAALQNPTITFQAGYHYLLRVIYTDDQGTSNYQIVHVYAITRTFSAPVISAVVAGRWDGDLDDGWTSTLTAYADVSTLIDRTHCVLFQIQHFGDNSSTPIYDNILMCGRIRSDSITTEGSVEAGVVSQVKFTVEGITAYLRRLRIPNDIIRATGSPDEWGEITEPNPYRMAVYEFWVYTTLTNLGSFGVETGAFAAWQIGGEPRGIDGGYALDVLASILSPIKAFPNWAPSGELFLAITTSYRQDRSAVVTVATLTLADMLDYNVERDSSRTTAQVIAFGGSFNTGSNTFVLYSAQSPSIVYGDGGETRELTREILTADASITDATAELSDHASDEYAYNNPKPTLKMTLFDSWCGVMIPTNYLRWAVVIPASSNTLGIAYSGSGYWQLQSVSNTINDDGTVDTSVDMPAETTFSDAQVIASLLPINLTDMNPVWPVLPNDPAYPTDPLEAYPTDSPSLDDLQAIDNTSAGQAYTPFSPDIAAQMTAKQGKPSCFVVNALFKNPSNTSSSPRITALGTDYLISVSGTSDYVPNAWQSSYNFNLSQSGFVLFDPGGMGFGAGSYAPPWIGGYSVPGNANNLSIERAFTGVLVVNAIQMTASYVLTADFTGVNQGVFGLLYNGATQVSATNFASTVGSHMQTITIPAGMGDNIAFIANRIDVIDHTNKVTLTALDFRGTGTNPFTGATPIPLSCDAFYTFDPNNPEIPAAQLAPDEGLFFDNSKYSPIPPYNPSHFYSGLAFAGTNNVLLARMQFNDYSTKSYLPAIVTVCPK